MAKLSKSDGPQQQEEIARRVSSHFTVGSFVVLNNRRGEIKRVFSEPEAIDVDATYLRILWDSGSVSIVKPIALN